MPHVELPQAEFKVVMLGDTFTGKTSLVLRFAEGHYRESSRSPTVGAFFITKRITVNQMTIKMSIWDTAGQEQFKRLAPMYYKGCAAAIVCYDPTSPKSFENLKYWIDELQRNINAGSIVITMCATKCDLIDLPNPVHTQVEHLAQLTQHRHITTSAKNNENVNFLFEQVAERVLQFQKQNKGLDIPVTLGTTPIRMPPQPQQKLTTATAQTTCDAISVLPPVTEEDTSAQAVNLSVEEPTVEQRDPVKDQSSLVNTSVRASDEGYTDDFVGEAAEEPESGGTRSCDSASVLMCGDHDNQSCVIC